MRYYIKPVVFTMAVIALACLFVVGCSKNKVPSELLEDSQTSGSGYSTSLDNDMTEKWAEGTINYQGHHYTYNSDLKNYLIMGIDKEGKVKSASDYTDGGQSDAMFIISKNTKDDTTNIISINRNTIVPVNMFDEDGTALGTMDTQICVQHGFGDGKRLSCNYSKEAVSRLFYQLPIDGYLAINIGAIPIFNSFVGGVEVEVLSGVEYLGDSELAEGNTITLSDSQAYEYLRNRDTNEYASADHRLMRQEQYLQRYLPKFVEKVNGDATSALYLYQQIEDYIVTDLDAEELIEELSQCEYGTDNIYTVPGETKIGEDKYEEYIVDEDALYELILKVFYTQLD